MMAIERTLSIIKPDAVSRGLTGVICSKLEEQGLRIVAMKRLRLSRLEAESFYRVHRERSFFDNLVSYMMSGPVVVMVLEGEGAIGLNRSVMGDTNPKNAAEGTLRSLYGLDIEKNSLHGSDSEENARLEVGYFFGGHEIDSFVGEY